MNPQKPEDNIEYRVQGKIEVRQAEGDRPLEIVGYAAIFDSVTELWPGNSERIRPGAFAISLRSGRNVYALVGHDPNKVLGRRGAGTLDVREDSTGLLVTIQPPDTQLGRDTVESIRRGDLDGMSFGFRTVREEIEHDGEQLLRSVEEAELFDVSVAAFAAYPDTSVAVRSLAAWKQTHPPAGLPVDIALCKLELLELTT